MLMVREVMHCKPGKVNDLVKKFQALGEVMKGMDLEPFRIYTDIAGERFWTLILEREYTDMDDITATESRVMGDEAARSAMGGYHDLVREGWREIYRVVD